RTTSCRHQWTQPCVAFRARSRCVDLPGDDCAYGCAYRLVSVTCILLQLLAESIRVRCGTFPTYAVGCGSSSRTFNPKVAGSIPARPLRNNLHKSTFTPAAVSVQLT